MNQLLLKAAQRVAERQPEHSYERMYFYTLERNYLEACDTKNHKWSRIKLIEKYLHLFIEQNQGYDPVQDRLRELGFKEKELVA